MGFSLSRIVEPVRGHDRSSCGEAFRVIVPEV